MRKYIFLTIVISSALACNFIMPAKEEPLPTAPKPAPTQRAEPTAQTSASSTEPFVISRINISNGDIMSQLAAEVEKAKALGLNPFIEFDATWCPPCNAINDSIAAQDPSTIQAFTGIYLVRADVDEWGWGDGKNFSFEAIPIWYELDETGAPTGRQVDGGAWNEDIPENFAPVLDAFFHGS